MYNYYPQATYPTIYGKIVDNQEMAKCQEVPIGTYAIFPQSNLEQIYVKSWNPDGTIKFTSYSPTADAKQEDKYYDILQNIQQLLGKLVTPNKLKRKEANDDEQ